MEQELPTLPEHTDPPVFNGVWFAQSLVLYFECFVDTVLPVISAVCNFSTKKKTFIFCIFFVVLFFLLGIVLFVFLRFTDSD